MNGLSPFLIMVFFIEFCGCPRTSFSIVFLHGILRFVKFVFVAHLFSPPLWVWIFQQVRLLCNLFQPLLFFLRQLLVIQFKPLTDTLAVSSAVCKKSSSGLSSGTLKKSFLCASRRSKAILFMKKTVMRNQLTLYELQYKFNRQKEKRVAEDLLPCIREHLQVPLLSERTLY